MKATTQLFEKALDAWDNGESKSAFSLFLKAAKLGDPGAQLNVGHFYETGEGVRKNVAKALYWYKSAWRSGHQTSACSNIAQLYAAQRKRQSAILWWRKAIERGDGEASLELAKFLLGARGSMNKEVSALLNRAVASRRTTRNGVKEARKLLRTR